MSDKIGLVILAAGKGQRLGVDTPKPLLELMGRKLIDYPLALFEHFLQLLDTKGHIGIIVGHQKDHIIEHIKYHKQKMAASLIPIHQKEQKGTANALRSYIDAPQTRSVETIIVTCVDTPLIPLDDLQKLYQTFQQGQYDAILASFKAEHPEGHGRIVKHTKGLRIVEEKDASDEIKKIDKVNSGLYVFKRSYIEQFLEGIKNNNKSGEYYLTDIFDTNRNVASVEFSCGENFQGINTMEQLQRVEKVLQRRKLSSLMGNGVRILDPSSTFIDEDAEIERHTTIHPFVTIKGHSLIKSGTTIEPHVFIRKSVIGQDSLIKANSYIDEASIGKSTSIGPYAHLRPKTVVEDQCRVGNFVEIKQSLLKKGVKVSHLSYVGDAEIGEETNIGCGFITCNYDGKNKHKTIIGKNTFIGSDSQMIAPITIGDRCYVASGSTINKDLKDGDFAIARSRQVTKSKKAAQFLKKK